ncbi:sirohydrochlorin chelatase [Nocardiopsis sp. DSM 44743]|uniref:Sirohydrochlorin chelatase n=1 Tax=Nocardiopsis lambiniae TaxID=3075539 RepID=A0ABU2MA08_9ACTN|nr:sirohydrochlorin chelatase [Nocardiopsis sp. DSM 44743]MDT0329504.1 sirohydrochlorin chelatase [Nocardiopsis sp. DSM 44743]
MRDPPVSGRGRAPGRRSSVPLLAVAHGSRDPRSAAAVEALFDRVRALRPDTDVRVSYLDHTAPSAQDALASLAAEGAGEVVVLPTLLTAAYHSKVDLPEVLERSRTDEPWVRVRYAGTLGPHEGLLAAVERRSAEAGAVADGDTALVVASAGSSDPEANATVTAVAGELAARGPWREATAAFASAARPTPGEAVAAAYARGARRVVVATYLLAPGFFADRVRAQALAAGATVVSEALGAAPELAGIVWERYDAALAARHALV